MNRNGKEGWKKKKKRKENLKRTIGTPVLEVNEIESKEIERIPSSSNTIWRTSVSCALKIVYRFKLLFIYETIRP